MSAEHSQPRTVFHSLHTASLRWDCEDSHLVQEETDVQGCKVLFPSTLAELDTEPRTFCSLESALPREERIMTEASNWLEAFPDKWQLEVSVGARWPLSSLGGRLGTTESPRLAGSMTLSIRRVGARTLS